jgi:hypothetical protein
MTNGSSLEKVDLPRSVGGFHSIQTYFVVFQAPSYCSPSPPRRLGWFLERLLIEIFAWQRCLPLWSDEVDGRDFRPTPAYGA